MEEVKMLVLCTSGRHLLSAGRQRCPQDANIFTERNQIIDTDTNI